MKDHLVIATAFENTVRIYAAVTTEVVEMARQLHDTWPTATAAFGRLLTGALIMGVLSDSPRRLTVRACGDGPLGDIVAVSNQRGIVKGYVTNPHVDLDLNVRGKLDVAKALGKGQLMVTKDLGFKEPYQGIIPLQTSEIAEDLAFYFTKSEQTPSAVALGVLVAPDGQVKVAGGFIVQLMPGADDATSEWLEQKLSEIPPITHWLETGHTALSLIETLCGERSTMKILEEHEAHYHCDCSRERFLSPLLSLGPAELSGIVQEQGKVEVRCHFCNRFYQYQPEDLMQEGD